MGAMEHHDITVDGEVKIGLRRVGSIKCDAACGGIQLFL
jgi:hypothetical protein